MIKTLMSNWEVVQSSRSSRIHCLVSMTNSVCLVIVISNLIPVLSANDWPQFRGQNSSGVYEGKPVPVNIGPGVNELWSLDLPPGHSSPVIHGDRLFLTSFHRDSLEVEIIGINALTGKLTWRRKIKVAKLEKGHPSFNPASSTPVTDGERVVAYFGSFGLVCFDVDGNELWRKKMPVTRSYAGNATSPAIIGGKIILYRGNLVDHFALALDKETGREIWKVPQEEPFSLELACTAAPLVYGDQLILHTARSVQSLNLANGQQNWVVKCATTATSTPVIYGEHVIVAAWNKMGEPALRPSFPSYQELIRNHDRDSDGMIARNEFPRLWIFHRPEGIEAPENGATLRFQSADSNGDGKLVAEEWSVQLKRMEAFRAGYKTHGMLAIPLTSKGLIKQSGVKTLEQKGIPEVPSPLVKDGLLYFVKNGGLVTCIDLKSDKQVYRKRIPGKGTYYSSPVIANQHIYAFSGDGTFSIIETGKTGRLVSTGKMGDRVYASPAVKNGVLYVRTFKKLFAFGNQGNEQ